VSKTRFVSHGEDGFWAYDVALGILLKHVADVAEPLVGNLRTAWLKEAVHTWRVAALLYSLEIEETWSPAEKEVFIDLVRQACELLKKREMIPAEEIAAWPILDDLRIFPRGATEVATAPVIELGTAIVELVQGSLPPAPINTWWCFGFPDGRTTIRRGDVS
jgi:hypothetical protein